MKRFYGLVAMMIFVVIAKAQTSLSFCTFVNNQNSECVFDNTKFITTPDSTHARIFLMLRSNEVFGTQQITYKVYSLDHNGQEVYLRTVTQTVQADWMNAWQPAVFVTPGKYMIKVYKDSVAEKLETSRGFEFFNN